MTTCPTCGHDPEPRRKRGEEIIKGLGGMTIFAMILAGAFGGSAHETQMLAGGLGFCVATAMMKW